MIYRTVSTCSFTFIVKLFFCASLQLLTTVATASFPSHFISLSLLKTNNTDYNMSAFEPLSKVDQLRKDVAEGRMLTKVDLSNCNLTEFPQELFAMKDSVEFINLGGNQLSSLPDQISEFIKLRILFFANNKFTHIPTGLGQLPNLYMLSFKSNELAEVHEEALSPSIQWLILTDNKLRRLPASIGRLAKLRKLMLSGNQLEELPNELRNCREIELMRIAVNKLKYLPSWIPNLPKLAWLAYSCNDFENSFRATHQRSSNKIICWHDVNIVKKLGEGASGLVYQGKLKEDDVDVAVKVFKGAITSDGLAEDEIKVNEAVGEHYSFVKVIGRISEHPEGKDALVFPLLPEGEYIILGNPPSFDSITRDTFPNDKKLSIYEINQILHDICQAAMHLHSCGIMHGDLYAHNILSKSCGKSLLTDFGAASFTKGVFGEKSVESKLLEQIEVRAFGNLADDLLRLCAVEERLHQDYSLIKNLVQQCTVDNVEQRPSFCQISAILDSFC